VGNPRATEVAAALRAAGLETSATSGDEWALIRARREVV
jgi:hypothetical protein